nr:hypothetical protein [Tanacetum cinerariifolium]
FAGAVSSILKIVKRYMDQRMNEAVKVAVKIKSDRIQDEAQAENEEFLNKLDKNIQKIKKEQVKEQVRVQVSKILPKIEKTVNEKLEAEVLTRSSNSSKTSYAVDADLSEIELKKILTENIESNKEGKEPESTSAPKEKATKTTGKSTEGSKSHQKTASESASVEKLMQTTQELEEPSHQEFEIGAADDQPIAEASQHPEYDLAKQADSRTSFNELMDTPVDFLAFLMNRLKVDTLTPELLAGPTYELMKGSCKSLVELKLFLEEVYKATTDQLEWNNPEGQQYPHNLLKPLPLIPNSQGRRVIPFDHFINNDLEIMGTSSGLKTWYLAQCGVKNQSAMINMISEESLIGGANVNSSTDLQSTGSLLEMSTQKVESSLSPNFRSSNGIITSIWIGSLCVEMMTSYTSSKKATSRGFTFKTLKICCCFCIVIQLRIKDLQLGVESYQKKLNLTKPDTYRSDLKRKEAYIAYSNPRGFIYHNKDNQNSLMRINELHKFSDGTLNDVRIALDDRLKAIDKQLKTRMIMRSLEKFVGGRLYEKDFMMLQRTI